MNRNSSIPKHWQFSFFLNSIPKKKRFSKWSKKDQETETLALVKEYFGYSSGKAIDILGLLSEDDITMIKEKLNKGGK